MKFEENWPSGFRGKVVQGCGRTDGRPDDGRQVIRIAHRVPSAQVS